MCRCRFTFIETPGYERHVEHDGLVEVLDDARVEADEVTLVSADHGERSVGHADLRGGEA
jgi:hypothetical protein